MSAAGLRTHVRRHATDFEQQLLLLFVEFQSDQNWMKMVATADTTFRWLRMNGDIRAERILS